MGVKVADVPTGIYGARIVSRRPFGSFSPEMQIVATNPYHGDWRAGSVGTFTTGGIGATGGNIITISVTRFVSRPPVLTSRNGVRTLTVPFSICGAVNDVEGTNLDYTIAYT